MNFQVLILFAVCAGFAKATVTFSCQPNGTVTVGGLVSAEYALAVQDQSGTFLKCTTDKASGSTTAVISGCALDLPILLTMSMYPSMSTNNIQASLSNASLTTYNLQCNQIPAAGVDQTFNYTVQPALVTQGQQAATPTYGVTSSLSQYTANVGEEITWSATIPVEYSMKVVQCLANSWESNVAGTEALALMTDNCPPAGAELMKAFVSNTPTNNADGTATYSTQLLAFQFYGKPAVQISCIVKVCPGTNCTVACAASGRRRRDADSSALAIQQQDPADGSFYQQTRNILYVNDPFTLSGVDATVSSVVATIASVLVAVTSSLWT